MGIPTVAVLVLSPWARAEPLGEGWVTGDPAALAAVPGVGLAEDRRGAEIRVLLEPGAVEELRRRGYAVADHRADHSRGALPEGYRSPEAGSGLLRELVAASSRAGFVNVGTSVEGRPIDGMWLGLAPGSGAPSYRLLGGHHGDEPSAVEVTLAAAERLVAGDGVEPAITAILDRSTVWIVPYVNPDGIVAGSRTSATGVDLNRNYDYHWNGGSVRPGLAPFSEPETRAIRALGTFDRPIASLSLHAGAANIGWPWNYTTDPPEDAAALGQLARIYARDCDAPDFWVTQGADWYVTYGDTNDWMYGRHGVLDFTVEVSAVKAPLASDLPAVTGWHVDAILALLAQGPTLSGEVVDPEGRPIEATLILDGVSGPFLSDPSTGTFHRITPFEPANLHVEAPGYAPVDLPVEPSLDPTPLTVVLEPVALDVGGIEPAVLWEARPVDFGWDGSLALTRADADPVALEAEDGTVDLDPALLSPGWWSVTLDDGTIWPRALLVEAAEGARVDAWTVDQAELRVAGVGFAEGARAWAVWGLERAPTEVPVVVEPGAVRIDLSAAPSDQRVDVAIWTAGAILGIDDAGTDGSRVPFVKEPSIPVGGCGCRVMTGHVPRRPLSEGRLPSSLGGTFLALVLALRRRTS